LHGRALFRQTAHEPADCHSGRVSRPGLQAVAETWPTVADRFPGCTLSPTTTSARPR
jgi:hypothetical protein